jgi:hypothetical protein
VAFCLLSISAVYYINFIYMLLFNQSCIPEINHIWSRALNEIIYVKFLTRRGDQEIFLV